MLQPETARPRSHSLGDIAAGIERLADRDNLAAALIHLNDTYFIDERPPNVPGMARVAELVRTIRATVQRLTGENRTLLLHSGDYLSPSALSQRFGGEPMRQLLVHCTVDYATLGNHEFDFGADMLRDRLTAPDAFPHVLTNLVAPAGFPMQRVAFWPPHEPFLAIVGFAGSQTVRKATAVGFIEQPLRSTIGTVIGEIRRMHPGVGGLIVLSHMDRGEDKALQEYVSGYWPKDGCAYVLGGHDHDMHWREADRHNCYLSKCRSNAKTLTVFLLTKDAIAAPFGIWSFRLEPQGPVTQETAFPRGRGQIDENAPPDDDLLSGILNQYRLSRRELRPDFRAPFERAIVEAYAERSRSTNTNAAYLGMLAEEVIGQASREVMFESFRNSAREISDPHHVTTLPVNADAAAVVDKWLSKLAATIGPDVPVIDFGSVGTERITALDATDGALRRRSTDFGNFVADAIKAATNADAALVNSGAFRIDGDVPPQVTTNRLRDVFIYDAPHAVSVIDMSVPEVLAFYDHSLSKGGHGAFLQVSEPRDRIAGRNGTLRVALVAHLLNDDEDGYQSLLAASRGISAAEVAALANDIADPRSMVSLIAAGASCVTYDSITRIRAVGVLSHIDDAEQRFVAAVDRFRDACAAANISPSDSLHIIAGTASQISRAQMSTWNNDRLGAINPLAAALRDFLQMEITSGRWPDGFIGPFYAHLCHARPGFEKNIRYQDYFSAVMAFFNGW